MCVSSVHIHHCCVFTCPGLGQENASYRPDDPAIGSSGVEVPMDLPAPAASSSPSHHTGCTACKGMLQHMQAFKAVLNWTEYSVRERLCLLEMFKLAVRFLIDVFDLGEQLCSRPVGRRSDVRNVASAGYGSMLLIGWTLSWRRRRNKKEAGL